MTLTKGEWVVQHVWSVSFSIKLVDVVAVVITVAFQCGFCWCGCWDFYGGLWWFCRILVECSVLWFIAKTKITEVPEHHQFASFRPKLSSRFHLYAICVTCNTETRPLQTLENYLFNVVKRFVCGLVHRDNLCHVFSFSLPITLYLSSNPWAQ